MNPDERKRRIERWSRVLSFAVLFTALGLPLVSFVSVLFMAPVDLAKAVHVPVDVARGAGPLSQVLVAAIGTVPVFIFALGLFALRPALNSFQKGIYFSAAVFRAFRRLAVALFASALVKLAVIPLSGAVLSLGQDKGSLSVAIGTSELLPLLLAAGFWLLSWIFTEAAEVEAENKQFV